LSLAFGANDMGSVMIEENVVRAAGASYCMDEVEIVRNIENAGFTAKRRNMHYEVLGDPIFRERAVPRRLALDVAKAEDDDDRIPDELAAYDARTPAARRQPFIRRVRMAGASPLNFQRPSSNVQRTPNSQLPTPKDPDGRRTWPGCSLGVGIALAVGRWSLGVDPRRRARGKAQSCVP
jgi:hypothetical protein